MELMACMFAPEVVDTSDAGVSSVSALELAVAEVGGLVAEAASVLLVLLLVVGAFVVATGDTVVVLGAAVVALGDVGGSDLGAS